MYRFLSIQTERAGGRSLSFTPTLFSMIAGAVFVLALCTPGPSTAAGTPILASTGCDRIVGTWRWFNDAKVECLGNGSCEATNGFSGPWKCRDHGERVEIRWSRGGGRVQYVDTLDTATDGSALSGTNQFGDGISAEQMAAATPPAPPSIQREPVKSVAGRGRAGSAPVQVALSGDQQETVELLGWPDAFSVQQVTEKQGPVGEGGARIIGSSRTLLFDPGPPREKVVDVSGSFYANRVK